MTSAATTTNARPACPSSLPLPSPKSPPECPDLYGKRREMAKVQMLEREIGYLQEELKSVEGLQPASICCKEIADFVVANLDPMIPTYQKKYRRCSFWKWPCGFSLPCLNLSWICCTGCSLEVETPHCCDTSCRPCSCVSCGSCMGSNKQCCCTCLPPCLPPRSSCCNRKNLSCTRLCCSFSFPRITCCRKCNCSSSCCECKCSCYPKCSKVNPCSCCSCITTTCCNPCFFCY